MELKLNEFKKAIEGFSYLVGVDLKSMENVLDKRLIDGIENGMIQKFEYSIELCWKLIKQFLKQEDGIDAKGSDCLKNILFLFIMIHLRFL